MGTAFNVLANPLHSNAWLAVLADAAIRGTALLLLAGLLTMAMRRASAAARHLVWSLALTGVLVLPVLSSLLPSWQVPLLPRAADAGIPSIQRPQTWTNAPEEPRRLSANTARFEAPEKPQKRESPTTVERVWKPTAATFLRRADWIPSVWMAGLLAALAPLLLGTAQVWRLARRAKPVAGGLWSQWLGDLSAQIGLKRRVTLLRSPRATMPMTWGILRPVVLLPSDIDNWPDERCRIVLLHEMAHIRRWDCLTQMLARMTCSLHWFNPLAWLAAHWVRAERERACDDMVLGAGSRPSEYAGHLLELARSHNRLRFAPMASVAMARRSPIENRLLAILDDSRSHRALRRVTVALALALGAGVLFPLAMARATAAPPKSETRPARLPDSATKEDRVAVAKANLAAAKAKAESSLYAMKRARELTGANLASVAEAEAAQAAHAEALAQVAAAEAALAEIQGVGVEAAKLAAAQAHLDAARLRLETAKQDAARLDELYRAGQASENERLGGRVSRAEAQAQLAEAEAALSRIKGTGLSKTERAALDARRDAERVKLDAAKTHMEIVKTLVETGKASEAELLDARAACAEAQARLVAAEVAAKGAESSLEGLLAAYDHEFLSSYTLKLLVSQPIALDPTQGVCTATVTVTGNGREHALIWNRTAMDRLHYRPGGDAYLGAPRAFQRKDESYRVNTRRKWVLYLGTQQWLRRFDDEDVFVEPDNSVSSTSTKHPAIMIGAFGDKDAESYFYRHILPLGRGYAQFLNKITSVVVDGKGIALVVAHGRSVPSSGGIWNLEIATNQGYLVRHAEFTPYGGARSIVCESSGYSYGPVPLGTRGSWVLSGYKVSVSLLDYSHQCDVRFLKAVATEMDSENWPQGTTAIDWRVVDKDRIPKRVR